MKLQDNFVSLSVLYFDQTASVCVILQGLLERGTCAGCSVVWPCGRGSSNRHQWLMHAHFPFMFLWPSRVACQPSAVKMKSQNRRGKGKKLSSVSLHVALMWMGLLWNDVWDKWSCWWWHKMTLRYIVSVTLLSYA